MVHKYNIMKNVYHVFCNNCLEFRIPGKFFIFYFLFVCLFVCLFVFVFLFLFLFLFSLFLFFCFLFLFFVLFFVFLFCFVFFFLFFVFVFLEVKTWKVKCYSLPFFLLAICNGKYLHRIERIKWIKQGQDCQKVITNKSLRIYIYIYIYIYLFITSIFSVFDLLDSFNLENVWYRSIES